MNKRKIYQFLRDLTENNSKEWMDEHRDRYHEVKEIWLEEVGNILDRLSTYDMALSKVRPRDTIMRINNNLLFHPDRPVYKDNFGFSPPANNVSGLYVHISPSGSFVAGGLYHPGNEKLKKVRGAIDYDGEKLIEIVESDSFQEFFGGLSSDPEKLKTSPKGYNQDHRHIELLRRKNFVAHHSLTQKEVVSDEFVDIVERAYLELKPLNDYLERALTV
jgi:uncharacterized protein (TIGR02453 family)